MGLIDNDLILADYVAGSSRDGDLNTLITGSMVGAVLELGAGMGPISPGEPVAVNLTIVETPGATGGDVYFIVYSDDSTPPTTEVGRTESIDSALWTKGKTAQVIPTSTGRYMMIDVVCGATLDAGVLQAHVARLNDVQSNRTGVVVSA